MNKSKKREDAESEKKKLLEYEKELMVKHQQLHSEQKAAQLLTEEGTLSLESSLKKGDLSDAQAAHALIKSGNDKLKSISEEMKNTMDKLSKTQQKRSHAQREHANKKQKLAFRRITNASDQDRN